MTRATILVSLLLLALAQFIPSLPAEAQSLERRSRLDAEDLEDELGPFTEEQLPKQPTLTGALAGPIDATRYRMGPGDVLTLEYTGRANMQKTITVDGEGRMRVPNLGTVKVAGRTLEQVREQVVRDLKPFIPGATIDLRLVKPRIFKVFVVGAINDPGVIEVQGSARVIEALDAAGGLAEAGSRRNIRILHSDGREEPADLQRFLWTGDWDSNPFLEDGDRVIVPNKTEQILVSGSVARQGFLEYRDGDKISEIIDIAGGTLSQARRDSILVIRFEGYQTLDTLVVDLDRVLAGETTDVDMLEDDRVFVRSRSEWHPTYEVTMGGEVRYPGIYVVREGQDRISDLIGWAGGLTVQADSSSVRLLRRPEIEGEDVEFDRLSRLTRNEMTDSEYQTFRGKLAIRQSAYLVDFSSGVAHPPESDVLLKNGDIIEAERIELAVRVDGSVLRPGFIAYQHGLTIQDYVGYAGGTTKRADSGKIRITRAGSNEAQLAKNSLTVRPGDFIWVPEKKDTSFWDTFKDVIAVAGQVAAILLLLDAVSRNN